MDGCLQKAKGEEKKAQLHIKWLSPHPAQTDKFFFLTLHAARRVGPTKDGRMVVPAVPLSPIEHGEPHRPRRRSTTHAWKRRMPWPPSLSLS
jgi:hypothetical protein